MFLGSFHCRPSNWLFLHIWMFIVLSFILYWVSMINKTVTPFTYGHVSSAGEGTTTGDGVPTATTMVTIHPRTLTTMAINSTNNVEVDNRFLSIDDIPYMHVPIVDCQSLFRGNMRSINRLKMYQSHVNMTESQLTDMTKNCTRFIAGRSYLTKPQDSVEQQFPLAFSIIMYNQVTMVERMLRAIYRPQNYYCIHVDHKAEHEIYDTMISIAKCFSNVVLSSRRVAVKWGSFSLLDANLACMEELLKYPDWKYFINLTGHEYPLRTNYELVRILQALNGSNSIEAVKS